MDPGGFMSDIGYAYYNPLPNLIRRLAVDVGVVYTLEAVNFTFLRFDIHKIIINEERMSKMLFHNAERRV